MTRRGAIFGSSAYESTVAPAWISQRRQDQALIQSSAFTRSGLEETAARTRRGAKSPGEAATTPRIARLVGV